jgi:hypothetical protein
LLNSLNRSLGQEDAYPFALTAQALHKLRFVHEVIYARAPATASQENMAAAPASCQTKDASQAQSTRRDISQDPIETSG